MASERDRSKEPTEPGWYWCRWVLGVTGKTEWRPAEVRRLNSGDLVVPDGAWLVSQHEWGPRIMMGAEHPDASLRERLAALAERWERERGPVDNTGVLNQLVGRCARELRALLTEGQPLHPDPVCPHNLWKCTCHPNPMCPHTLECLCEEDDR